MATTRWWKCDLQVATPAWDFAFPPGSNYDLRSADSAVRQAERIRFLDAYMARLKEQGVELIALADHNTGEWIDDAKAAGIRNGVVVFPGCEITTQTGADGVHLLIIGDPSKTSQDFDRLIHGTLGFGQNNPPFHEIGGKKVPASSQHTLTQILDGLPDDYLAIAPHVLNDNGVASPKTVKGDIRWKALHHERLVAVDPGDCSDSAGEAFGQRFKRRELSDFPRLSSIAFVRTSDAYSIESLGSKFTWIRMAEPSIEALRQACLDHESRIICDWSPKLASFPKHNPNNVRHAWIASVTLSGELTNSAKPLHLDFHPGLNVIIGGRGSGKSSVVSALRQLYSSSQSLPERLKNETEDFSNSVFAKARLDAKHHVQESQEQQWATWSLDAGPNTIAKGQTSRTTFSATVISQKELFERAAGDRNDPELTSRSLLSLIDSSVTGSGAFGFKSGFGVGFGQNFGGETLSTADYATAHEDARANWSTEHRKFVRLKNDLKELPALQSRLATLQDQVHAFFSEEVTERLTGIKARLEEAEELTSLKKVLTDQIELARIHATSLSEKSGEAIESECSPEYGAVADKVALVQANFAVDLSKAAENARAQLEEIEQGEAQTHWTSIHDTAKADMQAYVESLAAQGLSPDEFSRLQSELNRTKAAIDHLQDHGSRLGAAETANTQAWNTLVDLIAKRREARKALLNQVAEASGRLRFNTAIMRDTTPWIEFTRTTAGFRADAFIEDTKALAAWLWTEESAVVSSRLDAYQEFLVNGDCKQFQDLSNLRLQFLERIVKIDEAARYRMASELPDDVVGMDFLRENGKTNVEADWQSVVRGSPGQRTAAMLAFVLHHGREPLVLDQPEDDLDSEWISKLVVKELRQSRWHRQLIVVSHNANIPVLGDAEQVIALENRDNSLCVRSSEESPTDGSTKQIEHIGPVENPYVRRDIQSIMEGGVAAFVLREQKYNNETKSHRAQ